MFNSKRLFSFKFRIMAKSCRYSNRMTSKWISQLMHYILHLILLTVHFVSNLIITKNCSKFWDLSMGLSISEKKYFLSIWCVQFGLLESIWTTKPIKWRTWLQKYIEAKKINAHIVGMLGLGWGVRLAPVAILITTFAQ